MTNIWGGSAGGGAAGNCGGVLAGGAQAPPGGLCGCNHTPCVHGMPAVCGSGGGTGGHSWPAAGNDPQLETYYQVTADRLVALNNSSPRLPARDEIIAVLKRAGS